MVTIKRRKFQEQRRKNFSGGGYHQKFGISNHPFWPPEAKYNS
jgi:hypothetical protein